MVGRPPKLKINLDFALPELSIFGIIYAFTPLRPTFQGMPPAAGVCGRS